MLQAQRATTDIHIDGRLDEAEWLRASVESDFKQLDPIEGGAPSQRTEVRILFDDQALYIGARMHDSAPDSIVARLGRRDSFLESDRFGVFIDPYLDRRSGYFFAVTAAGTVSDGVLFNDVFDDESWDGVWSSAVSRDEKGWVAEMRIPYSQLRFYKQNQYTWGINFRRDISRHNERDYLVYTPKKESGFVSRFADLHGIRDIKPRRQVELLPYVRTSAEYTHPDEANPFRDGSRYVPDAGLDLKVGITSNLTLNATVNPDFGQVEVDPAVVNLSAYETFYPEKRPFFIEGASVFNFGRGGTGQHWGFNWMNPQFFYTRRIGRSPSGSLPDNDFANMPDGTGILGAAKVTGKVGGSWNVGTVHALTSREFANYQWQGREDRAEVEPLAYYGVARAEKEFGEGQSAIGFLATTTQRSLTDPRLRNEMNGSAYTGGIDAWTYLNRNKSWVLTGWAGMSRVTGSREQITALQQNSAHYFQRPDAGHVRLDSNATAVNGFAGRLLVNKQKGNIMFNSSLGWVSPGFDLNDIGFLQRTDQINMHMAGGYRFTKPGRFTREAWLLTSLFQTYDFEGNVVWRGVWGLAEINWLNYYYTNLTIAVNPRTINTRLTRGGPEMINLPGVEVGLQVRSDQRRQWTFGAGGFGYHSEAGSNININGEISWKPSSNVDLTVEPGVELNKDDSQWVDRFEDPTATATYGNRYVFAYLDQITFSSGVRLNWTFTPTLSLQLFAQPLISAGEYTRFKELKQPRTYEFVEYGKDAGSTFDPQSRMADPDGAGPAPAIEIPNPDFNFKSLRGNAVLRWEFRPGSTVYFVWTQRRALEDDYGQFRFGNSLSRMIRADADNVFMIKLTYWLGR